MHIGVIGKFPPIQGGVSKRMVAFAKACADSPHSAAFVTNADEVEWCFRQTMLPGDEEVVAALAADGVTIHQLTPMVAAHIPTSPAYESRLLGLSLQQFEARRPDVVLGWYLQPYGVVAAQVAKLMNIPYAITHAGSDITRLARHPDLRGLYRRVLEDAAAVLTIDGPRPRELVGRLAELATIRPIPCTLPQVRTGFERELDLEDLQSRAAAWLERLFAFHPGDAGALLGTTEPLADRAEVPRIGLYGKVGLGKGHHDLLGALAHLAARGVPFELVVLMTGYPGDLRAFRAAIAGFDGLARRIRLLPPVAPWRIPSFIRQCDIVCFLERDFGVEVHHPGVPREVLDAGGTLVVSREVIEGTLLEAVAEDGRSCRIVDDPRDTPALARTILALLEDPDERRRMAHQASLAGQALAAFFEASTPAHPVLRELEILHEGSAT